GRRGAGQTRRPLARIPAAPRAFRRPPGVARPGTGVLDRPARCLQGSHRAYPERRTLMNSTNAVTATVEVAVDPATAFEVFTEEIDRWWRPGPIDWYDSVRAV